MITSDTRFQHLVDHVHRLGSRCMGELLAEIAADWDVPNRDILAALERYAGIYSVALSALGGDRWPATPLHVVTDREAA